MIAEAIGGLVSAVAGGWVNKPPGDDYWYGPRGTRTQAGVDVDEESSMRFSTVFACVAKLSKTYASLPLHVYEKRGNERHEVDGHELAYLMEEAATSEMSGFTAREAMSANLELWGNAYFEIVRSRDDRIIKELVILPSKHVTPMRNDDGEIIFRYRPNGVGQQDIPADRIWHIPGLGWNGLAGFSPIGYQRESIGLGLAATTFGGSFFGNGAWFGAMITKAPNDPKALSHERAQAMLADLKERFTGPDRAFGFGMLRGDMDFKQIDMPFEDAMFLETRKFQRTEICGIFDVPPVKIHDQEKVAYNQMEQADLSWAKESILPRCRRIEVSAKKRFFLGTNLYIKHNLAGVVRGDFKTRMEGYATGRQWGLYSINDCRRMEDLNPIPNGDDYLYPLNMAIVGRPQPAIAPPKPQESKLLTVAKADAEAFHPMLLDASRRIVGKEVKALTNAFKRRSREDNAESFKAWLLKFYGEQLQYAAEALTPILEGFRHTGGNTHADAAELAAAYADAGRTAVLAFMDTPEGIPGLVANWQQSKAEDLAAEWMAALARGDS